MPKSYSVNDVISKVQVTMGVRKEAPSFDTALVSAEDEVITQFAEYARRHYAKWPYSSLRRYGSGLTPEEVFEKYLKSYKERLCYKIDSMYVYCGGGKHEYGYGSSIEVFAKKQYFDEWFSFMRSEGLESRIRRNSGNYVQFFVEEPSKHASLPKFSIYGRSRHSGRDGSGFSFTGYADQHYSDRFPIYFFANNYTQLL